jgi:hypothetical protein
VGGFVVAGVSEHSAKSKTPHPWTQLERTLLPPGQVSMNRVVSRLLVLNQFLHFPLLFHMSPTSTNLLGLTTYFDSG